MNAVESGDVGWPYEDINGEGDEVGDAVASPRLHYADTSFLASYYLQDKNGRSAEAWLELGLTPLAFTWPVREELFYAIEGHFRDCRTKEESGSHRENIFSAINRDRSAGVLLEIEPDRLKVEKKAWLLGRAYASKIRIRTLDITHVACALVLNARIFLTFDNDQRLLAKLAGLNTWKLEFGGWAKITPPQSSGSPNPSATPKPV